MEYLDPELLAEQEGIEKRRKIAEMIQAQSMAPIQQQQGGRLAVPITPFEGIAKVIQAYLGKKGLDEADSAKSSLATRAGEQKSSGIQKVIDSMMPVPAVEAQSPIPAPPDAMGGGPARPDIPAQPARNRTPQELVQAALAAQASPYEEARNIGSSMQKFREGEMAREDTQAARLDAAKLAADAKVATDAQRAVDKEAQAKRDQEFRLLLADKNNGSRESIAGTKLAAKDVAAQAKLTAKLPQAKLSKELVINNNDKLKDALVELRDHKGLEGITGAIYGRTPSISDDSIDAQAKLETIQNQVFVSTLQAMRASSKTGGAVGNVSDKEGERLENSMAALSRVQTTPAFKAEINKIISQLDATSGLVSNAFDEEYGGLEPELDSAQPSGLSPAGQSAYEKYRKK